MILTLRVFEAMQYSGAIGTQPRLALTGMVSRCLQVNANYGELKDRRGWKWGGERGTH